MRTINPTVLVLAMLMSPLVGYGADELKSQLDPASELPPGTYGGCDQIMVIGDEGVVTYTDKLHLTSIKIETDGSIVASFPKEAGSNESIRLQPSDPEQKRAVWTAQADDRTYKAKAIPHSEETYSFRLEVRRDGRLIAGAQVFCAICKSAAQPRN